MLIPPPKCVGTRLKKPGSRIHATTWTHFDKNWGLLLYMFGGYGLRARTDEAECADISAFNLKEPEYMNDLWVYVARIVITFSVAKYVH